MSYNEQPKPLAPPPPKMPGGTVINMYADDEAGIESPLAWVVSTIALVAIVLGVLYIAEGRANFDPDQGFKALYPNGQVIAREQEWRDVGCGGFHGCEQQLEVRHTVRISEDLNIDVICLYNEGLNWGRKELVLQECQACREGVCEYLSANQVLNR